MAITPTQVTVEELFGTKKYQVDFYQREYKWNDTTQSHKPIKALLDDIFYRFDLNYKSTSDISETTIAKYDWYYLNSYMTNTVGGNTYIVDGQQRLTTLSILTIALLKIGRKLGVEKGKLKYLEMKICNYDANGNEVFWMGFADRIKALKSIYEAQTDKDIDEKEFSTVAEKNILEAFKTIFAYLSKHLTDLHIFDAFRLYLFKRVYLISIDVDEAKDVAMAFEVINDRGIPLQAYEILKGKILGVIDKSDVTPYVDKWDDTVGKIADVYGDADVDYFLSTYFQSKYADTLLNYRDLQESRYHKTIYLDEFDKKIGFKNGSTAIFGCTANIKKFVNETLPFYGSLYLKMAEDSISYEPKLGNESYSWFNRINEQDTQYYLMFASIGKNDPEKDAKYTLVTREFDRLYTLLNLYSAYVSNEFNASVIELGMKIRDKNLDEIKSAFDDLLLKLVNKSQNRTDITDAFKYDLFSNTGYTSLGKRFLRYFFARVDWFIASETNLNTASFQKLISRSKGNEVHHIEHILAHDNKNINASLFDNEEIFELQRNRLGGLLLLKGLDNQSSSNELYSKKLRTYTGNGTLFAQTLLSDFSHSNKGFQKFCDKYGLEFKTYTQFDAVAIEERQKLLFEMVKLIWR